MDRGTTVAVAAGALLVGLLLLFLMVIAADTDVAPPDAPEVVAAPSPRPPPRPVRAADPVPQGAMARQRLEPPPSRPRPTRPPKPPAPAALAPEEWQDYNYAVEDVVQAASIDCIEPWLLEQGGGEIELVLDAVLWDGVVVDYGLRGLTGEAPPHVLDCIADRAWEAEGGFPRREIDGELRLQRSFTVKR